MRKTGKILTPKFAEDFLFGKDPDRTMKITGRLEGDDIVQQVIAAVKQQKGITITEDQARKLIQDFEKSKIEFNNSLGKIYLKIQKFLNSVPETNLFSF